MQVCLQYRRAYLPPLVPHLDVVLQDNARAARDVRLSAAGVNNRGHPGVIVMVTVVVESEKGLSQAGQVL